MLTSGPMGPKAGAIRLTMASFFQLMKSKHLSSRRKIAEAMFDLDRRPYTLYHESRPSQRFSSLGLCTSHFTAQTGFMDHRTERISEAIREELVELIGYEMSDPRVANVVVTAVHISPDKRKALIRFGVQEGSDAAPALEALEHGKSFLKRQLGVRLNMFRIPELYFEADQTAMLGARLDHLMRRIKKGRPRDAGPESKKKAVE